MAKMKLIDWNNPCLELDVEVTTEETVQVFIDGFGAAGVAKGCIVELEMDGGVPVLRVWADINQEDPTHRIDLSGAAESKREES